MCLLPVKDKIQLFFALAYAVSQLRHTEPHHPPHQLAAVESGLLRRLVKRSGVGLRDPHVYFDGSGLAFW